MRNLKCSQPVVESVLKKSIFVFVFSFIFLFLYSPQKASSDNTIHNWEITSSLPYNIASHVAFATEDRLFILGGSAFGGQSKFEILESQILETKELGGWSTNSFFPTALIWHSAIKNGNNIFVLGGLEENPGSAMGYVNKVFGTNLIGTTFSSWSQLTPLPQALAHGGVFIANDRLYFVGGLGNTYSEDIYSAEINPDGTIGTWENSGTLPNPTFNMAIFERDGIIYMLGGAINGVGTKKVYTATLNESDGYISGWQQLPDAPSFPTGQQTVLVGDTIIFVSFNKTYFTKILSPGVLDVWTTSASDLPDTIGAGRLIYSNGYLYLIGGHSGYNGYLNTVYYSKYTGEVSDGEVILDVPLLKQTDPLWSEEIYDSANEWASTNPGIGRWGCAMTSAAMVFNYHKITKLPDGTSLNPKNLNKWLISQPDGYVGNGLINWIALTRLSRLSKSQNPEFTFNALEYSRNNSDDQVVFKENIDNNLPTILGQPGHFIVGKGYSDSAIIINDPGFDRSDLASYSDTFLSMGTYKPSNTDLSYIMIVNNSKTNAGLLDDEGQLVGFTFEEGPIVDPSGGGTSSTESLSITYVEKPESGNYRIEILSNITEEYDIDIYLYESDGDVVSKKITGVVSEDDLDVYTINFSKNTNSKDNIYSEATFESLIKDIELFYELGKIKTLAIKKLLILEVKHIQRVSERNKRLAKIHLLAFPHVVKGLTPRHIEINASQSLIRLINDLRTSL